MRKGLIGLLPLTLGAAIVAALIALPTVFAANGRANGQSAATPEPIVGFWNITLTAPDGTVFDWGLQQWHSDGTEILNSGLAPKRFCLGMWVKAAGPSTYEINHFPLDYSNGPLNIINIREKVTLSPDHNSMTGTFTFDVYDAEGNPVNDPGGNPIHIVGDVEGHRITMGTSVEDILPPPTP